MTLFRTFDFRSFNLNQSSNAVRCRDHKGNTEKWRWFNHRRSVAGVAGAALSVWKAAGLFLDQLDPAVLRASRIRRVREDRRQGTNPVGREAFRFDAVVIYQGLDHTGRA